jgi:hypothetical protein
VPPKVDLKKVLDCYRATRTPRLLEVPELSYLAVDGHGDPNTTAWTDAVRTLYPVAYALKSLGRRELDVDHVVMPLEGLWWAADMAAFTDRRDKARWSWTAMIAVPEWVTGQRYRQALDQLAAERRGPRIDDLRLEPLAEGLCVQLLHVGSYDDEAGPLRQLHEEFLPAHGLTATGRHHEVYLSDARRVAPDRLRTILRQPVRPRVVDAPVAAADIAPRS